MASYDKKLDLSGVSAPANLLRVRKALEQMDVGQTLLVFTDARRPERDFAALGAQEGYNLLGKQKIDTGGYHFAFRKT